MIVSALAVLIAMALGFYSVNLYERHRYAASLSMFMCTTWAFTGSLLILWRVA